MNENNLQQKQPNNPVASPEMNHSPLTTHHSRKRKVAFTLAEVLITLGIIGVIAALTIPSLIQKQNDRVAINKFKKMYSIYCQAYQRAITDNGGYYKDWSEKPIDVLQNYLNVANRGVREFSVYTLSGEKYKIEGTRQSYLELADGGAIIFSILEGGYIITGKLDSKLVLNKNIFPFSMSSNGAKIAGMSCGLPKNPMRLYSGDVSNGCPPSAIEWILANDNMDYMYCPDKLIWGKKVTCKP